MLSNLSFFVPLLQRSMLVMESWIIILYRISYLGDSVSVLLLQAANNKRLGQRTKCLGRLKGISGKASLTWSIFWHPNHPKAARDHRRRWERGISRRKGKARRRVGERDGDSSPYLCSVLWPIYQISLLFSFFFTLIFAAASHWGNFLGSDNLFSLRWPYTFERLLVVAKLTVEVLWLKLVLSYWVRSVDISLFVYCSVLIII